MSCPACGNASGCSCAGEEGTLSAEDNALLLEFISGIGSGERPAARRGGLKPSSSELASVGATTSPDVAAPGTQRALAPLPMAAPAVPAEAPNRTPGMGVVVAPTTAPQQPQPEPLALTGPWGPPKAQNPWDELGSGRFVRYAVPPPAAATTWAASAPGPSPWAQRDLALPRKSMSGGAKAAVVAGSTLGVLLALVLLLAIAIPTALSTSRGATLFKGGVPNSWSAVAISSAVSKGSVSNGVVVAAWRTPGRVIGGDAPAVAVVLYTRAKAPEPSLEQWLASVQQQLTSRGLAADRTKLANGAPAVVAPKMPGYLAGGLASTTYAVFAAHDGGFYMVAFNAGTQQFASEVPAVARVLNNFLGSGR
ncbi:MAG TPA: hypothetical protein VME46_10130 [Acidimicrobiales bacterium]|nr:hypothetical protein [Acidimicrobiales bacterium]